MFLYERVVEVNHGMLERSLDGRLQLQSLVAPRVRQPPPRSIRGGNRRIRDDTPVQTGHILSRPLPRHPFVTLSGWGDHRNVVVRNQRRHLRDHVGHRILLRRAVGQ
jgi:hypothetical protein